MSLATMKVLIVEDDPLHRAYLRETVTSALPECGEVLEAGNGLQGEQLARDSGAMHIVMDLQMNTQTGIEAARTIWRERPQTCILFWSNYSDEAYVRGVSRIVPPGAAYGYVLKTASEERLKLALRGIFVESQCVIDREVRGMQHRSLDNKGGFTDSEYAILLDVALGLTDRTISRRRGMSLRSVQNRLQHLYDKLEVYSAPSGDAREAPFNLRARAVSVAFLRKLLNYNALQEAEADLANWLERQRSA